MAAQDRKQFAIDKIKKEVDKFTILQQYDIWEEVGKHIHDNKTKEQEKLRKQADDLNSLGKEK